MSVFYANQNRLKESVFILDKFLGCDFTQGDFITDYRRSPNCKNLIWGDNPYIPRMRSGYKPVAKPWVNSPNINGIHVLGNDILVHAGTKLYKLTGTAEPYDYEEMNVNNGQTLTLSNGKTRSFLFETVIAGNAVTCLYILGGGRYLRYDGTNVVDVKSVAHVPFTVVGRTSGGGGQNKEAVNLLSASQIYSFYVAEKEIEVQHTATANETTMTLQHSDFRNLNIYKETENGDELVSGYSVAGTTVTFNAALSEGVLYKAIYLSWDDEQDYLLEKSVSIDYVKSKGVTLAAGENNDYQYNSTTGVIHFATAPTGIRGFEGSDTIEVKFTKETSGASKIENCTVFDIFGGKNDTRVFLAGNSTYPNIDWYSGLYDASYFPDNCFTIVGTSNTKIMGYIKQYNTQMIIKEDNAFEASAYLRQYSLDNDGNDAFPVEQGITGVGAVSFDTFGYLNGEPLFLTSKGVVGVSGTNVDYRNLCQDRSEKINSRLIVNSLSEAISVDLNNKYYLFVNGGVYVADARMMYKDALGNPQYEWHYWDGISAQCAVTYNGKIYFGYKGVVYRFKVSGDEDEYIDETENKKHPISAFWETPRLYFGSISNKKSIPRIHCFCDETIMAKMRIEAIADERQIDLGLYDNTNQIDFGNIDFAEFLFDGAGDDDVKSIHAGIQRFTSIKFKFSSVEDAEISNLGFGLKMLQVNYIYLEELKWQR